MVSQFGQHSAHNAVRRLQDLLVAAQLRPLKAGNVGQGPDQVIGFREYGTEGDSIGLLQAFSRGSVARVKRATDGILGDTVG